MNARGELFRRKGDRVHALADFGAAFRLDPNNAAAKANYKALSLEVERIGAMMAVNNRPSFNCATARRPVEKAICANPELANLDREINAVNTRVVREAGQDNARAGRAMQREQDEFLARRNAAFGQARLRPAAGDAGPARPFDGASGPILAFGFHLSSHFCECSNHRPTRNLGFQWSLGFDIRFVNSRPDWQRMSNPLHW